MVGEVAGACGAGPAAHALVDMVTTMIAVAMVNTVVLSMLVLPRLPGS